MIVQRSKLRSGALDLDLLTTVIANLPRPVTLAVDTVGEVRGMSIITD